MDVDVDVDADVVEPSGAMVVVEVDVDVVGTGGDASAMVDTGGADPADEHAVIVSEITKAMPAARGRAVRRTAPP